MPSRETVAANMVELGKLAINFVSFLSDRYAVGVEKHSKSVRRATEQIISSLADATFQIAAADEVIEQLTGQRKVLTARFVSFMGKTPEEFMHYLEVEQARLDRF